MSAQAAAPTAPKHTQEAEALAQGTAKNVKVTKNTRLRALYDYQAQMQDELNLQHDQEYIGIRLLEPEENWWYGTTLDGSHAGIFPANYVEVKDTRQRNSSEGGGTTNPIAVASSGGASGGGTTTTKTDTSPTPDTCCCIIA